ncbi:epoxide hydrolase 4-like [Thrips palmi]|uniref:Epoxide hydrolase 4-like n=1 Tax=Thrips palmi TaxID=161013 RepID=A0A6P8ZPN6_THRPL|nr:epoxide hydrolase 4-like [Thrips palmi]XP_034244420.1 epoxide hydrolase 4-like [Thrips palmi]
MAPPAASQRTASIGWVLMASVYVYSKAFAYSCMMMGFMLLKQLTTPRWLFGYKTRTTPPQCLQDPDLGQHGYVTVKGEKFHYVGKGDRAKPLMLFVHGFPDFWYSWRHQMKEFSRDYWTVAVDMRGYGGSPKPADVFDYAVPLLVDDIKGIVTALGREKFILVGHDWGAVISWAFLDRYPEMIEKYIIMNGPNSKVFMQLQRSSTSKQSSMSWYMYLFQVPYLAELFVTFGDFGLFRKMLLGHKRSSPFVTDGDIEAYKYTFSQPGCITPPFNYYRAFFRSVILKGLVREAKKAKTENVERPKGLYIFGAKDVAIDVQCVGMLKEQIENLETKIIEDGNHFVHQDEPVAVNKSIQSFLK